MTVDFGVRKRSGIFVTVWPLATVILTVILAPNLAKIGHQILKMTIPGIEPNPKKWSREIRSVSPRYLP